jgi:hypothetical protein
VLCHVWLSYGHSEDGHIGLKYAGQNIYWFLSIYVCVLCQFLMPRVFGMYKVNDVAL